VSADRWQDYGPLETTTAPRSYVFGSEAPPVQHRAAAKVADEPLPRPHAAVGVVTSDPASRTLTVRLSKQETGYARLLWRDGLQLLRQSEEAVASGPAAGYAKLAPTVWADVGGGRRAVHGRPGQQDGTLEFSFAPGVAAYAELVGKPNLTCLVTMDKGTRFILGVKFFHRPAVGVRR
jgi:hypothetical protein